MAIRKRGSTWQIDYIDPSGKRVRKSFKLKKDADAEHGKRISLIAEGRYLDIKKDCKTTVRELLQKYEENFRDQRSFKNWKRLCIRKFSEYFGEQSLLSQIRFVDIETYKNRVRQTPVLGKAQKVRSVASVNREMAILHHVLQKGVEWEMIEKSPFERGKGIFCKENNTRTRYLTQDEITRLLTACPPHLQDVVVCALNTGMRREEILSLRWDQIRNGFIYLQKTKTDTPRQIPVNDALNELFKGIRKMQKVGTAHVFTFNRKEKRRNAQSLVLVNPEEGTRIKSVKAAFTSALRRAGIEDFRFHDLRHTFASHMIMRGASLKEVQEILGHKTMTMTLRYAHLSGDHKKKAVNLLNGLTAPQKEVLSQNVTKPDFEAFQTANCL